MRFAIMAIASQYSVRPTTVTRWVTRVSSCPADAQRAANQEQKGQTASKSCMTTSCCQEASLNSLLSQGQNIHWCRHASLTVFAAMGAGAFIKFKAPEMVPEFTTFDSVKHPGLLCV